VLQHGLGESLPVRPPSLFRAAQPLEADGFEQVERVPVVVATRSSPDAAVEAVERGLETAPPEQGMPSVEERDRQSLSHSPRRRAGAPGTMVLLFAWRPGPFRGESPPHVHPE
jgi:hypothetical protein